jgi:Zn-dependent M28 family amino/carboxypeptidase
MRSSFIRGLALSVVCAGALAAAGQDQARTSAYFDSARLLQDLRTLSADDMQGRQAGTPGGEKARAYVIDRFKASGVVPFGASYESPFTFTSRRAPTERHGVNVIGRIDGASEPRRYIVVSAHYDHIGVAATGQVNNGADDNASGTAALFALARYFSANKPAHSLLFAAFDAEESGLKGAYAFLEHPPIDAALIGIDLNMDMIGRDPDDKLFVVGTALQPFLKPFIDRLAARAPVKLLTGHEDPKEKEDWTKDSDHYAFMEKKIPALYFGVEDFDQHHKPTDDYETMTKDFYVRAVETMILVVKEFDARLADVDKARTR